MEQSLRDDEEQRILAELNRLKRQYQAKRLEAKQLSSKPSYYERHREEVLQRSRRRYERVVRPALEAARQARLRQQTAGAS